MCTIFFVADIFIFFEVIFINAIIYLLPVPYLTPLAKDKLFIIIIASTDADTASPVLVKEYWPPLYWSTNLKVSVLDATYPTAIETSLNESLFLSITWEEATTLPPGSTT